MGCEAAFGVGMKTIVVKMETIIVAHSIFNHIFIFVENGMNGSVY